jgi:cobalt/nickel transport system ATP-binding protein
VAELLQVLRPCRRRLPLASGPRLALAGALLAANIALGSAPVSAALALAAALLCAADQVELSRLRPYLLALLSVAACVAAGRLAGASSPALASTAARAAAGLAIAAWIGATSRWSEVRALAERAGLGGSTDILEGALAQGQLLGEELRRGREAVAVRTPSSRRSLEISAMLLAGAFERALSRLDALDETRALRSAPPAASPRGLALEISRLSVAGCCGPARLKEVDLRVESGAWVALAGPSGSGKTTLLKTVAGLLVPEAGEVRRFGLALRRGPLSARVDGRVALVFQDPSDQMLGATPAEDVAWALRRRGAGRREADERARAALDALGIGALADRPVGELSFGERKRAAFAGALATGPDLLLCDEPTMGLDPVAAARLVRAVESAAASGPTVLWATHDLDALPRAVERVVLLSGGRVAFDGPRAEGLSLRRLEQAGLAEPSERPISKGFGFPGR